jgi:hypothetical protein
MEQLNDEQIENIVSAYKKKREAEIKHYHTVLKNDEKFKEKNRYRAKVWYDNNKDKRKQYYEDNKDFQNAKNIYKYHLKKENLEYFKTKHADKYKLLVDKGFIQ